MRGFKIAKNYDETKITMPSRSTAFSAGYDLALYEDIQVAPGEIIKAKTGLKAYMQDDEVLIIVPRSSLPDKFGLTIPNNTGIIDKDYYGNDDNDGAIFIQLINMTDQVVSVKAGTRIAQGIFQKYLTVEKETAPASKRTGGFGSTD